MMLIVYNDRSGKQRRAKSWLVAKPDKFLPVLRFSDYGCGHVDYFRACRDSGMIDVSYRS